MCEKHLLCHSTFWKDFAPGRELFTTLTNAIGTDDRMCLITDCRIATPDIPISGLMFSEIETSQVPSKVASSLDAKVASYSIQLLKEEIVGELSASAGKHSLKHFYLWRI